MTATAEVGSGAAPARVGFVIDDLEPVGGTENQLRLLLRSFDPRRISPFLCCLRNETGLKQADVGCPLDVLDAPFRIASSQGLRSIAGARAWARRRRVALVVTFLRDANIIGTIGARWAGCAVVSSRRNLGRQYWHTPREIRILRILNRLTSGFVSNSEAVREYTATAEKVDRSRIAVLPNAVDIETFHPRGAQPVAPLRADAGLPNGFLIGCVANLRPIKGLPVLLQAFAASSRLRENGHLLLIGSGPQEPELRRSAAHLGIGDRTHLLGSRSDVAELLRALDLAVLPSLGESSPNAVLEYMASGLPIVATRVGGVPELLSSEKVGLVVAPGEPAAMQHAMERLYSCAEERLRMGAAARERAQSEYSLGPVVERWTGLLERWSARCPRGA